MEPTQVSIPWADVIKLALSTGVIAAVINQSISWIRDSRSEGATIKRDATYLAMRAAVILEQFAIMCAEIIGDNLLYTDSDGYAGEQHGKLPELDQYPTDADWKSLDPSISARALSLPNEILLSDRTIATWEKLEPAEVLGACNEQAGKCGYRAWLLASDLRRRYQLPGFDPTETHWDLVGLLKEKHDKATQKVAEMKEPNEGA